MSMVKMTGVFVAHNDLVCISAILLKMRLKKLTRFLDLRRKDI
jgi:hypothetical protein